MPMIDVYAPTDLFPAGTDGLLGKELTMAVLRAEGVATPGPFHLNNTAAFIHRMDPRAVRRACRQGRRGAREGIDAQVALGCTLLLPAGSAHSTSPPWPVYARRASRTATEPATGISCTRPSAARHEERGQVLEPVQPLLSAQAHRDGS